jgi:hypothetical protein
VPEASRTAMKQTFGCRWWQPRGACGGNICVPPRSYVVRGPAHARR